MVLSKGLLDQPPECCLANVLIDRINRSRIGLLLVTSRQKLICRNLGTLGIPLSHYRNGLPQRDPFCEVGLVKEGHHDYPLADLEAKTEATSPVAEVGQEGFGHHCPLGSDSLPVLDVLQICWSNIVIAVWIVSQKIFDRVNAEGRQVRGPFWSHAL